MQRVHIDYAEKDGQNFLVIVDSHSKWLEVLLMSSTSSNSTIMALRNFFAAFGLTQELVSDNGPQFVSEEFETFLKLNGIKHTLCPLYHPASNGLAERNVQTFKQMLAKSNPRLPMAHRLANILFNYRNTPHSVTGKTPAELFLKRAPHTILTLVKPNLQSVVQDKQAKQKVQHDGNNNTHREIDLYQKKVRVRNVRGGKEKWIPGTVTKVMGPLTYLVRVPGNNRRFVHVDHLIADDTNSKGDLTIPDQPVPYVMPKSAVVNTPSTLVSNDVPPKSDNTQPTATSTGNDSLAPVESLSPEDPAVSPIVDLRRSTRRVKPPSRLDL